MKILNLYAGIGGNRRNWGEDHEITAIELDPQIAKIYQDHFPNDKVIIADAHKYLEEHFSEYDFIWSSPPCPSHSIVRKITTGEDMKNKQGYAKPIFPDMKLYEEILFLRYYFKGKYCVENVVSFYPPLIPPQEINKHYFWANFMISPIVKESRNHYGNIESLEDTKGFNLSSYKGIDKRKALRNCVEPETGKHILDCMLKPNTLL